MSRFVLACTSSTSQLSAARPTVYSYSILFGHDSLIFYSLPPAFDKIYASLSSHSLFSRCFSFGLRFHYFHLFSSKSNLFRFSNVSFRFRYNRIMWWASLRFYLNFPSPALFLSSPPLSSDLSSWELEECLLILTGVYVECTLFFYVKPLSRA